MPALSTAEKVEVIQQAVAEGKSRKEIAAMLGVWEHSLRRFMRSHGLSFRPNERRLTGAQAYAEAMKKRRDAVFPQIRDMLAAGVMPTVIMQTLGISRGVYRATCDENGIVRPGSKKHIEAKARTPGANFANRAGRRIPETVSPRSLYTDAATFLAPHYRPVVRADVVDDPYSAPKGEPREYIVGTMRVPAVEMLDIARGLGFPA